MRSGVRNTSAAAMAWIPVTPVHPTELDFTITPAAIASGSRWGNTAAGLGTGAGGSHGRQGSNCTALMVLRRDPAGSALVPYEAAPSALTVASTVLVAHRRRTEASTGLLVLLLQIMLMVALDPKRGFLAFCGLLLAAQMFNLEHLAAVSENDLSDLQQGGLTQLAEESPEQLESLESLEQRHRLERVVSYLLETHRELRYRGQPLPEELQTLRCSLLQQLQKETACYSPQQADRALELTEQRPLKQLTQQQSGED